MIPMNDSLQANMNFSIPTVEVVATLAARSVRDRPNLYMPIYILTVVFGAVFIVVPWFLPKGPNRGLIKWCIMLTSFSMWLFWVTVYIAQMNPLLGPRIENDTLAWIIHSRKSSPPTPSTPPEKIEPEDVENEVLKRSMEDGKGVNITLKSEKDSNVQRLVRYYNNSKECVKVSTDSVLNISDHMNYKVTKAVTRDIAIVKTNA